MLVTVPLKLKNLSAVVVNDVVKKKNSDVEKLKKIIPDMSTLIHINQHNTDKQGLENKIEDIGKKNLILLIYY